jgi:hypothetical protein
MTRRKLLLTSAAGFVIGLTTSSVGLGVAAGSDVRIVGDLREPQGWGTTW